MDVQQPLIVTARMDEQSFAFFDRLRKRHFPPERNFLAAHLTLFHSLPGEELEQISNELDAVATATEKIELAFTGWCSLGLGVAMNVESQGLDAVRAEIARCRAKELTPQDRQPFKPHITVQNKVEPATARELWEKQNEEYWPASGHATGLDLWKYLGGPWKRIAFYKFTDGPEQ